MRKEIKELLLQALETELGGVKVYEKAIQCAVNKDLKEEWEKYHDQTTRHVEIVEGVFEELGLDKTEDSTGRQVVHHIGEALIESMDIARTGGEPKAAELAATEAVELAETKDHQNWELLKRVYANESGELAEVLKMACDQVEDEEDEHIYHTKGWSRELWIDFLGMPSVLPPPEEEKDVKTAIGQARAANARIDML